MQNKLTSILFTTVFIASCGGGGGGRVSLDADGLDDKEEGR